jgi:hypothetical protein
MVKKRQAGADRQRMARPTGWVVDMRHYLDEETEDFPPRAGIDSRRAALGQKFENRGLGGIDFEVCDQR